MRKSGPGSGPGGVPAAIGLSPILSARYRPQDLARIAEAAPGSRLISVSLDGHTDDDLTDVEVLLRGPLPEGAFDRLLGRTAPAQVLDLGISEKDWKALNLPSNKRLIYDTLTGFTLNQHILYIGETGGGNGGGLGRPGLLGCFCLGRRRNARKSECYSRRDCHRGNGNYRHDDPECR